jgi:hypothetical protein
MPSAGLAAGAFVWLDLENPGDHRAAGPSFDAAGDSTRALVPSSNWGRDPGDILGIQVMFTDRFLLTAHSEPCRALAGVQRGWDDLPHDVKADGPSLLFFILDQLIGSFEPDLVQLDGKLDQIQLALLGGSPPGVDANRASTFTADAPPRSGTRQGTTRTRPRMPSDRLR